MGVSDERQGLNLTTLGLLNLSLHYPIYQIAKTLFHCTSRKQNICFCSFGA